MLTKLNNLVVTFVKSVPVPFSTIFFSVVATAIALPLSLGSTYLISGQITMTNALVTVATTSIISLPISYLICSIILFLQKSEGELAKAQSTLAEQVGKLAAARHDAVAANRAKSAFLAQMSHELRTPLNAVIGFSDILAKQKEIGATVSQGDVIEYAQMISHGGNTLLSLVNDLLDLSKIEAGEMKLSAERVNVSDAVGSAVSFVRVLAKNRAIALQFTAPPAGLEFMADKRALGQILINLLSNAIKFSPAFGKVTISVRQSTRFLAFNISDQGPGMSGAEQAKAVQPFAQLGNAMVATEKGTGLGLPIVKSLIELEGGTLLIDSKPGSGTTVSIRYPIDRVINQRADLALSA